MKFRLLSILTLLVIVMSMSSCFQGRWSRYHAHSHYVHKKHYRSYHRHSNRDW